MARLNDNDIEAERSFANATFEELLKAALADVGLSASPVLISNTASRRISAGVGVKVFSEPVTNDEVRQTPSGPGFRNVVTAKLGETWLQFLERHFAKQGLFVWTDANGRFILSRPNGEQEPAFHFYRKRGVGQLIAANVKSFQFTNDTTRRFTEVVVFARQGGRKFGHNHTNGSFVDEEMKTLGFRRRRVFRDANVTTAEEAEFYARRKIAEANRAGWKLQYTISGHSAPTMRGSTRAVVCPDMIARVDDDELGIHENLYIEACEYRCPPRTTVVTLMRPRALVFGEIQSKKAAAVAKRETEKVVKKQEERSELDILGLRFGGAYGYIPPGSDTDNAIERARKR